MKKRTIITSLITLGTMTLQCWASKQPNVVLIYTDDQGWGDVGYHGYDDVLTPNIDKLAAEGTQFSQGYVSSSVCGPSRCGLLTGVYQQRLGVYGNYDKGGIPLEQPMVFELMKKQGYHTGAVGKWHVGAAREEQRPNSRGVDFFYGFLFGAHDYYKSSTDPNSKKKSEWPIMRNTEIEPPIQESKGYLTEMFNEEAVGFIERAPEDEPFFLYLAYNAVHYPWDVPQPYIDRVQWLKANDERKLFAGMLLCVDDGIGAVMEALKKKGVAENTLVIFMSDNGTPRGQGIVAPKQKTRGTCTMSNPGPYNGFKGDVYEGGIRVPMVLHWPGKVPAGETYEHPVFNLDLVPTILAQSDVATPYEGYPFDGVNLLPFLNGAKGDAKPHDVLYWRRGEDYAIRDGDWKLQWNDAGDTSQIELFDMVNDSEERINLASKYPERAQALKDKFDAWDSSLVGNQNGNPLKNRNVAYPDGKRVDVAAFNANPPKKKGAAKGRSKKKNKGAAAPKTSK